MLLQDDEYRRHCGRVVGLRHMDEFESFLALVRREQDKEFQAALVSRMDSYEAYLEKRAAHVAFERVLGLMDEAWDVVTKEQS